VCIDMSRIGGRESHLCFSHCVAAVEVELIAVVKH